jgi:hypothetical protein
MPAFAIMSLKMMQVLERVFAILAAVGLAVDSVAHWAGWLFCFLSSAWIPGAVCGLE